MDSGRGADGAGGILGTPPATVRLVELAYDTSGPGFFRYWLVIASAAK